MVCFLCQQTEQPLGFQIKDNQVCQACEEKLVETDVCDKSYDYYIERFKLLWQELLVD
ncbi:MAG: inhibitor of sigma-G Gin [Firmicutes bacterium]|nr:inhibitor of sigma-G Gin [Bacillota bacterium]